MDTSEDHPKKLGPKKSLGQNFLTSQAALAHIIEAASIAEGDNVLEIGPGKGALTDRLLKAGARVAAVEKDRRLIPELREKFAAEIETEKLMLLEGDILEIEPGTIFENGDSYKLVANIPYYITGHILRMYLSASIKPSLAVLLVQKEVAERILARDGKESLLSLSVKAYGTPRIAGIVKAGSFFPKPNVDSAILAIEGISDRFFKGFSEEKFFAAIHAAFAQKRKMLRKNLGSAYSSEAVEKACAACSIAPTSRAEDIALAEWACLCKNV